MACGAAESGLNAGWGWRVPSTQTPLSSRSDALPVGSGADANGMVIRSAVLANG